MHVNTEQRYPLTHPQKRIWYTEQLNPGTTIHHICGIGHIQGEIDIEMLQQSMGYVISEHEAFQIVLINHEGGPVQIVSPASIRLPHYIDFSEQADPVTAFDTWLSEQLQQSLELLQEPLYRFYIYKRSEGQYGIFAKLHHLIFDGWSTQLLTAEICRHYERLAMSKLSPQAAYEQQETARVPNTYTYANVLEREQQYIQSTRFDKDRLYWNTKFEVLPEQVFPEQSHTLEARKYVHTLSVEETLSIRQWLKEQQCSLNDYFVLLMGLCVGVLYGREAVTFGLPVYNRSSAEDKQMIGMFTSTMPIICSMKPEWTIVETVKHLQKEIRRSFVHQKYPFDLLVQDLQLKHGEQHSLFQISVNYYPFIPSEQLQGQPFQVVEIHSGQQHLPLQLVIKEWEDDRLTLELDYQVEQFSDYEIELMMERLRFLSEQITIDPSMQVQQLSIITNAEKRMLFDFNDTATNHDFSMTVLQLFERQTSLHPHQIALSMGETEWTYQQLYRHMIIFSEHLAALGIGLGDRVGVYGTHSMEMVAGILAIMNTGAAYVPMDCDYPVQRIQDIVQDSEMTCILLNQQLPAEVGYDGLIIELNSLQQNDIASIDDSYAKSMASTAKPEDLAYMIYTSGSTGKPKGVMIRHSNLVHYCSWANEVYPKQTPAVFALYSSLAFDLTITSLFTPLIGGHEIRIYEESKQDFVLFDILRDNRATVLKLTPAHLSLLCEQQLKSSRLETLIVGGENLKVSLAHDICSLFDRPVHLYNEYGPTEATVGCMIHEYNVEADRGISVPIGQPAANVQLYVLDEQLQPTPVGGIGELFISGTGVAKGYWNQPERTAASFLPSLYADQGCMYRTGDLVRFTQSGQLEYIGRKDRQTKINGYRIELEEIEAILLQHSYVKQAVVIERQISQHSTSDLSSTESTKSVLCGYVVLHTELEVQKLRAHLLSKLPGYMVPGQIVIMEHIPLTVNGKVDSKALPEPSIEHSSMMPSSPLATDNEEQKILLRMLSTILNIENVVPEQNFFELGGDSIKAIQLSSRLRSNGYMLKAKDILAYPIISDMAARLMKETTSTVSAEPVAGLLGSPPIHEWFWAQSFAQPSYYHQSILLRLEQTVTQELAKAGLQMLVERHDALRLNMNEQKELYFNPLQPRHEQLLQYIDLSNSSPIEQQKQIEQTGIQLKSSFNLATDLLFQAIYYDLGSQGKRLLLVAHHLVIDGVSWRILLEDLAEYWTAQQENRSLQLQAKTDSYQHWSRAIEDYRLHLGEQQLRYWKKLNEQYQLSNNDPDLRCCSTTIDQTFTLKAELDVSLTTRWLLEANTAYQTQSLDLLIIALAFAMKRTMNEDRLLLELEGHGREEFSATVDISRTVGWFTSMFPVSIKLPDTNLEQQIKQVKEQLRQVPDKGFPYLPARYTKSALLEPLPDNRMIRFNYLGDLDGFAMEGLFDIAEESTGADVGAVNAFTVDMDIQAMIKKGRLCLSITCSHYSREQMHELLQGWQQQLAVIVDHCVHKDSIVYTPTDFDTIQLDQDELDSLFAD